MATPLYLTDTAGAISPGPATGKAASLSRGAGVQASVLTFVSGPTSGQQFGDTLIEWFFQVDAVTISGTVTMNVWGGESSSAVNGGLQAQVDEVNSAGTLVHAILNSEYGTELAGGDGVNNWTAAPTSTTVTGGNYLRLRILVNDAGGTLSQTGARTVTLRYAGTGAGASGDTYIQFSEAVTAYSGGGGRVQRLTSLGVG